MDRIIKFTPEQDEFRKKLCDFIENEFPPYAEALRTNEITYDAYHEVMAKLNDLGAVCPQIDPKYGGKGKGLIYAFITTEEFARHGYRDFNEHLHSCTAGPYFIDFCNEEQKQKWLPDIASGKMLCAVAMTEPDHGSDLGATETLAVPDGDDYVINGEKIFCTNGMNADMYMLAARIQGDEGSHLTLFAMPADTPGFSREILPQESGILAQRTRLHLKDVRLPAENMIGERGMGFKYMMHHLQQERLVTTIGIYESMVRALNITVERCKERVLFGSPLSEKQYVQFEMAKIATQITSLRPFMDALIMDHLAGKDVNTEVAMAKLICAETSKDVIPRLRQMWGGYGLTQGYEMWEMAKDFNFDGVFAGTSEVMMMVVSRSLFPRKKKKK